VDDRVGLTWGLCVLPPCRARAGGGEGVAGGGPAGDNMAPSEMERSGLAGGWLSRGSLVPASWLRARVTQPRGVAAGKRGGQRGGTPANKGKGAHCGGGPRLVSACPPLSLSHRAAGGARVARASQEGGGGVAQHGEGRGGGKREK
jgi:hypothetical protein